MPFKVWVLCFIFSLIVTGMFYIDIWVAANFGLWQALLLAFAGTFVAAVLTNLTSEVRE